MQGSEEAMSTTGYAYAIVSFSLLKIDGGAIENTFPGGTWERVHNLTANFYFPKPLPREVEGKQMQFSS
jgi:hypothetical protein